MRRSIALLAAVALVAAACGSETSPDAGSGTTTLIAVGLDDACQAALEDLGSGFNEDDVPARLEPVMVALEAEPGLPADTRAVLAEMMRAGDESLFEAFANIEEAGYEKCSQLRRLLAGEPDPMPPDEDEVRAALAAARRLWEAAGWDEYTLTVSFESDDEGFGGAGEEPPCGAFGGFLLILVGGDESVAAFDKFSGCEVDTTHSYFAGKPFTVDAMFAFIDDNAPRIYAEYDEELGAPRWFGYEDAAGFFHVSLSDIFQGHPDGGEGVEALEAQRAIWEAAGVTEYRLTVATFCFCPPQYTDPYTVTVAGGAVVSVLRDGMPLGREMEILTVGDLFDFVFEQRYADSLDVSYHNTLGYPTRIVVDPSFNAIDEEITYTARVEVG